MKLMKLTENSTALISRMLIAINRCKSIQQQRILFSALGAFNPFDSELKKALICADARAKIRAQNQFLAKRTSIDEKFDWEVENTRMVVSSYFRKNHEKCKLRISVADFVKFWVGERSNAWDYTKSLRVASEFVSISYSHEYITENGKIGVRGVSVFSQIDIVDNEYIDVEFNYNFMPYIVFFNQALLDVGYTKIPLRILKAARSEYTIKLIALILKNYNIKKNSIQSFSIPISEFRDCMDLGKKYVKFADLRRYVIERSLDDIASDPDPFFKITDMELILKKQAAIGLTFTVNGSGLKSNPIC